MSETPNYKKEEAFLVENDTLPKTEVLNNAPLTEEEERELSGRYNVDRPLEYFNPETREKIYAVRESISGLLSQFDTLVKEIGERGLISKDNIIESISGGNRIKANFENYNELDPVRALQDLKKYEKGLQLFNEDLNTKIKQIEVGENDSYEVSEKTLAGDLTEEKENQKRERRNLINEANIETIQENVENLSEPEGEKGERIEAEYQTAVSALDSLEMRVKSLSESKKVKENQPDFFDGAFKEFAQAKGIIENIQTLKEGNEAGIYKTETFNSLFENNLSSLQRSISNISGNISSFDVIYGLPVTENEEVKESEEAEEKEIEENFDEKVKENPEIEKSEEQEEETQKSEVEEKLEKPEKTYKDLKRELFETKKDYKEKEKAYKEALDGFYNQGGFAGNLNKVKRFFGFNPKLPDELEGLQADYRAAKHSYTNKFSATLASRSEMGKNAFTPPIDKETGLPIFINPPVYREYNENSDSTRMAFLNKFVLKENAEFLKKQEVHILSEKQIEARNRILAKIANSKLKTPLILGVGTTAVIFGGLPTVAALSAGFATRLVMGRGIKNTEKDISNIKSSFSIKDLEKSEVDLLSAEILKQKQERNRRIASSAAALAAAGTVNHFGISDLGDITGQVEKVNLSGGEKIVNENPTNVDTLSEEEIKRIWSEESGGGEGEFDLDNLSSEQRKEFFGANNEEPNSDNLNSEGKKELSEAGQEDITKDSRARSMQRAIWETKHGVHADIHVGDGKTVNTADLSPETQAEIKRVAGKAFLEGDFTTKLDVNALKEIEQMSGAGIEISPSVEKSSEVLEVGKANEKVGSSEEVWNEVTQGIREKSAINNIDIDINKVEGVKVGLDKDLVREVPSLPIIDAEEIKQAMEAGVEVSPDFESIDHVVEKGDRLWKLTEKMFPEAFEGLTSAKKNLRLTEVFDSIQNNPDLIEAVGLKSGNVDLIYPGEKLNLSPIKEVLDKISNQELALNPTEDLVSDNIFTKNDAGYETLYSRFENDFPMGGEMSELNVANMETEAESRFVADSSRFGISGASRGEIPIIPFDQAELAEGGDINIENRVNRDVFGVEVDETLDLAENGTILNPEDINNSAVIEGENVYAKREISAEEVNDIIEKNFGPDEKKVAEIKELLINLAEEGKGFPSTDTPEYERVVDALYDGDEEQFISEFENFYKDLDEASLDFFDKMFGKFDSTFDLIKDAPVEEIKKIAEGSIEEVNDFLTEMGVKAKYESFMDWVKFIDEQGVENVNLTLSDLVAAAVVNARIKKIEASEKTTGKKVKSKK